jgi:uncharacterized protein YdiU (UPF0061 family)
MKKTGWNFDNTYVHLPRAFYTRQNPDPVREPRLVALNECLAAELGLDAKGLNGPEGAAVFAGNRLPEGAEPLAQAYAGHQFGHFTVLGDGRTVLLGEQITPEGDRFDIQLKGSGQTPYSRRGDGRAALGPMLREYIISEAMHRLGVPTTRSLAVVTTGEDVIRDTILEGAILTRVAASHLRVGTFEYARRKRSTVDLRMLADYTIRRHFPRTEGHDQPYLALLQEVAKKQADLISRWMQVGFIHGVMNTDNMALSGETIDYGPCAFMDAYHPGTVFSSIDHHGRYAYGNQPSIAGWNLARFAETLLPLLHPEPAEAVKLAQDVISGFPSMYKENWLHGMRAKIGITNHEAEDEALIVDLLGVMQEQGLDYTNTFLDLTFGRTEQAGLHENPTFAKWFDRWQARLARQAKPADEVSTLMRTKNAAVIPRNHRVEEALDAAVLEGDYSFMHCLMAALANPYAHTPDQAKYAELPPPSARPYRTFCGT